MSALDNRLSSNKLSNNYGKIGFPMNTIPSLPFQSNINNPTQTSHQHNIKVNDQLYDETVVTKYKSSSKINSPKGQVRFCIPNNNNNDNDNDNNNNNNNFDISQDSIMLTNVSPSKIVFPKNPNDPESQSTITSSINQNTAINQYNKNVELLARVGIEGHLVDMQSKVVVNVSEEIWNFHHNRNQHKSHQKSKSMNETSLNHSSIINSTTLNSNKTHHRSKSLQSIISQTLNEFNSFNDPNDSTYSIGNVHNSKFNDSQISQVSPLNYPSFNNSNPILRTPNKSTNLYLTSDSPINKHNVPIPLEISLPPFLSPKNQNKKRNSLIYDGESYSVYNEEEEENLSYLSNGDEGEKEDTSTSGIRSDSLISTGSIPSMTYNISFDANVVDPDSLLGIDDEANVNLKRQFRNLRRQKSNTIDNVEKSNEIDFKILPPLPIIPQTQKNIQNNDSYHQIDEKASGSNLLSSQNNIQHDNNVPTDRQASKKIYNHRLRTHSRLSKMIDEYNSSTSTVSPINKHISNNNDNNSVKTCDHTNESLAILTTPSKSIIIPDLDDILLSTPNNTSQSFTSTNNTNSSLKFFDQFEPLYQNKTIVSPSNNSRSYGQLDTSFKFPPLPPQQLKIPIKQNYQNNNHNNNSSIQYQKNHISNDYQRTPQDTTQVEKRRQKLLASHLSPNNRIGHSHRRSRSIHSMDFMTPQKFLDLENLPPTPSLPFNATSTPPEKEPIAPRRSSLRLKESPIKEGGKAVKTNQLVTNIVISPETIDSKSPSSNNNSMSDHNLQSPIKPLSSFQSFSSPIKNENLIPNIRTEEVSKKQKSYNLLSPRRQLSNSVSNQSSSVNSQFSKDSQLTQTTAVTDVSSNNIITHNVKPNFPNNKPNTYNDSYKVIRERQKDGRIVDVIVLDDNIDEHNTNCITKGKHKHHSMPNNNNEHILTCNYKRTSPNLLTKNYKSPLKMKYNSNTKKEQMEHYIDILDMCENTATKAKQTIFELAGIGPQSKPNV